MKHWQEAALKRVSHSLALGVLSCALLMAQGGSGAPDNAPAGTKPPAAVAGSDDAGFRRVSNRLLCQCGCGYMVLSCNHLDCSSATFIRRTIQTQLAAGKSEDAIVAGFVEQYGPRILPEPPRKGFSLSAWVMPFVVLVLGGILVSYILWRMKFRFSPAEAEDIEEPATGEAPPKEMSPAVIEKYRAQIDRDLENE
ncbi:MAG: cytochrome c-type biogenesis protein CcmH [Acidobacteria bacterium]|nr:cytochrome c-type biogenesis protein CcmH [Acidobacteriota bacterium]